MRAFILLLLLSGCADLQMWKAEQDLARYSPYCEKIGFQPNTPAFAGCVQQQAASTTAASHSAAAAVRRTTCTQVGVHLVCN